jgi:nicotinate-nucleotide pyrophosphorylase (carboxylating)
LEKEAVLHGGGFNHRMSLSDRVMLKDNHIKAAGSIMESVYKVRRKLPTMIIEVEVETVPMFIEALESACDWIMLDNMSLESMAQCVALNQGKKILEASGNMTLERIRDVAQTGVDYISVGSLTHSYKSLDLSLKF